MKKVLYVATIDNHIKAFHLPYLKLLHDMGYEVHVATNGSEIIPYCDVKHQICIERSPYKFNNIKAIKQLKRIINDEKFDIIHCHTPMGSVVTRLAAKSARRKYHTRVIYTAHGFHFYKGAPKLNWMLFYPVEKYLAKFTDTLITINKEDYNLANRKFCKRCKDIQYVPGVGVDINKFNIKLSNKERKDFRKSLNLNENDFVLTCVARLDKNKNQSFLINVVDKMVKEKNNIHLLLVGPDELNGYYQNMVHEKHLDDNIHFLGKRDDIPNILAISDIVVSASLREGLPVNVIEAFSAGKPVVALNCRGMSDLIENGKNGFIISDLSQFTIIVLKLYNDSELYSIISKNSFNESNKYSVNNVLNNMRDLYLSCSKLKVLHLLYSNTFSGAENVVCTIIKLANDICNMAYCCPFGSIKDNLNNNNIKYFPLKKFSYFEIKKVLKEYNPDIIHAHDNRASCMASLFSKKIKIVSHIHGNNKIMRTVNTKTILFNLASKFIDNIIWVSQSSYDDYVFHNKVSKKSIILYNVIDKENLIIKSNEYACKSNFDLIFLGRLAYPKNPERLIEIVKLLKKEKKNISLAIVGDGVERNKLEKLVDNYKLSDNVTFFGFRNNPFPILKKSKILIMTSIYEGTPMVALEAQALGKPIVATPVDGLKRIVNNYYNGFLSDDNSEIINFLLNILSDNDKLLQYVNNSKKRFDIINNEKSYIRKIIFIYEGKGGF